MNRILRRCRVLLPALVLCALAWQAGAQEFKTTPAKEVAANPQRFWARGLVFRDVMTKAPGKDRETIGERTTYRFETKVVGECFAEEKIAPVLQEMEPGREYIFTGTVFSEKAGLFRRKTRYVVVVEGVIAPAEQMGALTESIEAVLANGAPDNPFVQRLNTLRELIVRVQEAMTSISATEQIERGALFDPSSEHADKLAQVARRVVNDLEVESKVPGREHLAQLLIGLVALKEGALQPPPTPVAEPAPEPESVEQAPPAEPAPEVAPPAEEPKPKKKKKRSSAKDEDVKPVEPEPTPAPALRWQIPAAPEPQPIVEPTPEDPTPPEADESTLEPVEPPADLEPMPAEQDLAPAEEIAEDLPMESEPIVEESAEESPLPGSPEPPVATP